MSLEKIASKQNLNKEDVILAAQEYAELEKQAAAADAYGRELAHKYVEELTKKAEAEKEKEVEETEEEKKAREAKEKEAEKTSSDKELIAAIESLKALLK